MVSEHSSYRWSQTIIEVDGETPSLISTLLFQKMSMEFPIIVIIHQVHRLCAQNFAESPISDWPLVCVSVCLSVCLYVCMYSSRFVWTLSKSQFLLYPLEIFTDCPHGQYNGSFRYWWLLVIGHVTYDVIPEKSIISSAHLLHRRIS